MLYTRDMCVIDAIIDNANLLDYMHVLSSKVQYTMLHIFAVVDNYPGLFCCYRVCRNRLQYSECTKLIEFLPFRQRISSKWLRSETQSNVSFDSPTFNSRWWRTSFCIHTIFCPAFIGYSYASGVVRQARTCLYFSLSLNMRWCVSSELVY